MSTDSPTPPVIDPSPLHLELFALGSMSRLHKACLIGFWRFCRPEKTCWELKLERVQVHMKYLPGFPTLPQVVVIPA